MKDRYDIIITGVAGMIGSHLLDALIATGKTGKIIGIDDLSVGKYENIIQHENDPSFLFLQGSILDNDFLATVPEADIIVHLAAAKKIGEMNPGVENLKINGIGTENILKLALRNKAKFIMGSTSDCYGMSEELPFREDGDSLLGPSMIKRWSYAVGKLYAEQLTFAYMKDFDLPVVVLRYFGGFSERASFTWSSGHLPLFIDWVLKDEECIIHGDGSQTRSMTHVANLVAPTVKAVFSERAVGELINVGDDHELSILEYARMIHALADTGNELKLKFLDTEEIFGSYRDIQRRCPDLTKARDILEYSTDIPLEEAILRVIEARKNVMGAVK